MLTEFLPSVGPQEPQQFSSRILSFPQNESIARTYTMDFDETEAGGVKSLEDRERFTSYKLMNMETHLGERFNVGLVKFSYSMKDGVLWGKDMKESAINNFIRGRDIRKNDGNVVDFAREDAEIIGFSKMQEKLADPTTSIGTMMLTISPPGLEGTSYNKNFYQTDVLREDEIGVRYVESTRFASGLKIHNYQELLRPIQEIEVDAQDPAASLLANPIEIPNAFTPEGIHEYLHKDIGFLDGPTFEMVKKKCKPLAMEYTISLLRDPLNRKEHAIWFNAYLNKADAVLKDIETNGIVDAEKIHQINTFKNIMEDRSTYGFAVVRSINTGCGLSEGYDTAAKTLDSPYSVMEYGKKWDYHKGNCVVCKDRNLEVGPCSICKKCEKTFDKAA